MARAGRGHTPRHAIALLTDLRAFSFLAPFLGGTHTLTSAARVVKRPASTLAHWLPRFVETGLVEHRGDVLRAGLPMPRYRTPARKLVVPFELIPFDARVRLFDEGRLRVLRRFMDGMDEALEATEAFGLSFAVYDEGGGSIIDLEQTDAERARRSFTDGWMTFELTEEDAARAEPRDRGALRPVSAPKGPEAVLVPRGVAPDPQFRWRSANDR